MKGRIILSLIVGGTLVIILDISTNGTTGLLEALGFGAMVSLMLLVLAPWSFIENKK